MQVYIRREQYDYKGRTEERYRERGLVVVVVVVDVWKGREM